MKRSILVWGGAAVALSGVFVFLILSNPVLSDYQAQVLTPLAQERRSASDAMLASILQSLPIATSASQGENNVLTLLTSRTKHSNYLLLSMYSTELDYCEGSTVSRSVTKSIGIAGRFYMLEKGNCSKQENTSS